MIDTHHNQDKVFKESLDLFLNQSLDFFGINQVITEILSTEVTVTTKKSFADSVFKTSANEGLHFENELDISQDDILRFCSSNIDLTRKHNIPFNTIILTPKTPKHTQYNKGQLKFTPTIISLNTLNADKVLEKIKKGILINEIELIYLPLYTSKTKTMEELFEEAIEIASNSKNKDKIFALQILLMSTFIDRPVLSKILEDNMFRLENNPAIEFFIEKGMEKGRLEGKLEGEQESKQKITLEMLGDGVTIEKIAKYVKMPVEWVEGMSKEAEVQLS